MTGFDDEMVDIVHGELAEWGVVACPACGRNAREAGNKSASSIIDQMRALASTIETGKESDVLLDAWGKKYRFVVKREDVL